MSNNQNNKPNNNQRKENHLLSQLEQKYGKDFMGIADTYKEFNNPIRNTMLIKSICRGQLNFKKWGICFLNPVLLTRLVELASNKVNQYHIQWIGTQNILYNNNIIIQNQLDQSVLNNVNNYNADQYTAWMNVYNALTSVYQTGTFQPLAMLPNVMRQVGSMTKELGRIIE